MLEDLSQIRILRKKLGISQKELARLSGVSQSLIAKIESKRIDPSYSNALKLIKTIQSLRIKNSRKAYSIMTRNVITVSPNDRIEKAIHKMKRYKISQMPVVKSKKCVGLISESTILNAISKGEDVKLVKEIMKEAPPIVSKNTTVDIIIELLKFSPIVLITESGNCVGVITKSDIINKFYK